MYYAIHCNSKSRCVHVTLARHVTCINMYIHVSLQDVTGWICILQHIAFYDRIWLYTYTMLYLNHSCIARTLPLLSAQGVNHFAGPLEMWLDMSRYDMWRVTARQSKHRLESFFPRQVIQGQMFCRFVIWPFFLFLIERPFDLSTFRIGVPACRQRQAWREKIRRCGQSKLKKNRSHHWPSLMTHTTVEFGSPFSNTHHHNVIRAPLLHTSLWWTGMKPWGMVEWHCDDECWRMDWLLVSYMFLYHLISSKFVSSSLPISLSLLPLSLGCFAIGRYWRGIWNSTNLTSPYWVDQDCPRFSMISLGPRLCIVLRQLGLGLGRFLFVFRCLS